MRRGNQLSFDRDEALKRAMQFFWRHGYEAAGLTKLLEYMDVPRQSFYNTFGSKEKILIECIGLYSMILHQAIHEALAAGNTPSEKLDRLFDMWEREDQNIGCFFGNCVAEFGAVNEEILELLESKLQSLRGIFSTIFQEAIDRGDLPADRSVETLANTLVTYSQGIALMKKTKVDESQMRGTVDIMKQSLM